MKFTSYLSHSTSHIMPLALLLLGASLVTTAADWPQWRGPERKAVSRETGLLQSWPAEGPKLARTIDGIGKGPSSPIIARGRVFIAGHVNKNQMLFCFSTDGRKLWEFDNGSHGKARFGAQSSALVDNEFVYILSETGRLAALDFNTGKEIWSRSYAEFNAPQPKFLYADSLIIHGEKLICMPGGKEVPVIALDKTNGKELWKGSGLDDQMAYCSGIIASIHGVEQYLALTEIGLVSIYISNGQLLWRNDGPYGEARNSITPIVWKNHVFADSGRKGRAAVLKILKDGDGFKVETIRETAKEESHLGGFADLDGRIYGHNGTGWICIDMESGKELYCNTEIANCSTIYADSRFYSLSDRGVMYLIEADDKSSRIVSQFTIPNAGQQTWARPAIADGLLYLRKDDKLFVYDIKGK